MSRMALCNMLGVIILSLCPLLLQAQISFSRGNVTYAEPGSVVKLPWTYSVPKANILAVEITFTKSGSSTAVVLAKSFGGTQLASINSSFTIEGEATLVFTNAKLDHNGTYTLLITLNGGTGSHKYAIKVIILKKPTAFINCPTDNIVKEGDNFVCLCYSSGGNPPAIASWYKDGMKVSGPGYLNQTLSINITKEDAGNYSCVVKSHDLNDTKQMEIDVQYGPTKATLQSNGGTTVGIGESFMLTCSASAFPLPNFTILRNGTDLKDNVKNGVLIIKRVTLKDGGRYECIAKNRFGNATASFTLTVTENKTTPIINTTMSPTPTDSNNTIAAKGDDGSDPLGVGPIVGIVIGVVVVIVIIIVLVYFLVCKSKEKEGEGSGSSGGSSVPRDDGEYETVDKSKVKRGDGAGPSNDSIPAGETDSMPPVYAVVEKNKKKMKPAAVQPTSVTYASLDPVALQPDSSKMHDRAREETNYASINLENLQSDLV